MNIGSKPTDGQEPSMLRAKWSIQRQSQMYRMSYGTHRSRDGRSSLVEQAIAIQMPCSMIRGSRSISPRCDVYKHGTQRKGLSELNQESRSMIYGRQQSWMDGGQQFIHRHSK